MSENFRHLWSAAEIEGSKRRFFLCLLRIDGLNLDRLSLQRAGKQEERSRMTFQPGLLEHEWKGLIRAGQTPNNQAGAHD